MKVIKDWKGNEIKGGMTIHIVSTKPIFSQSRWGMFIPSGASEDGKSHQVWESDEEFEKRKGEEHWILGPEYEVVERGDGGLNLIRHDGDFTFAMRSEQAISDDSIIAIKGTSDKK